MELILLNLLCDQLSDCSSSLFLINADMLVKFRPWSMHSTAAFILRRTEITLARTARTLLRMRLFTAMINFRSCLGMCRPLSRIITNSYEVIFHHLRIGGGFEQAICNLYLPDFGPGHIIFLQNRHCLLLTRLYFVIFFAFLI